jgi:predicted transposase YdaD
MGLLKKQRSHNPHDKVFKELLRHKVFAKAFIKQHFSKKELARLDLSTLELWNASFIHDKRESHSDVVY